MKTIYKYLIMGTAALSAVVSCDLNSLPEFNDADSFAAFDMTSISVNEDAGTVTIPVTIASLEPKKAMVTYEAVDGTAVEGTNYTLADESAVLSFDGTVRTQNIVINIKNIEGYTGNRTFTVNLVSAGSLNLGYESSCTVRIVDLDHPLASILGSYAATATDDGLGSQAWTLTLSADEEDTKMVWIDYITPFAVSYPSMDFRVYGNVSEDLSTITIPCGQSLALYDENDPFVLCQYLGEYKVSTSGNIVMTTADGGTTFTTENGIGFVTNEYVFNGAMLLPGTTTWTKQ